MKHTIAMGFALFALGCLVHHVAGCRTPVPPEAAEAAYGAALLRCVDDAETLAESRSCRAKVNAEWGIVETVTDGGAR